MSLLVIILLRKFHSNTCEQCFFKFFILKKSKYECETVQSNSKYCTSRPEIQMSVQIAGYHYTTVSIMFSL